MCVCACACMCTWVCVLACAWMSGGQRSVTGVFLYHFSIFVFETKPLTEFRVHHFSLTLWPASSNMFLLLSELELQGCSAMSRFHMDTEAPSSCPQLHKNTLPPEPSPQPPVLSWIGRLASDCVRSCWRLSCICKRQWWKWCGICTGMSRQCQNRGILLRPDLGRPPHEKESCYNRGRGFTQHRHRGRQCWRKSQRLPLMYFKMNSRWIRELTIRSISYISSC